MEDAREREPYWRRHVEAFEYLQYLFETFAQHEPESWKYGNARSSPPVEYPVAVMLERQQLTLTIGKWYGLLVDDGYGPVSEMSAWTTE